MPRLHVVLSVIFALSATTLASAVVNPFTEDFTSNASNWKNFNSSALLSYSPAGGPDGGSFASGTFNFSAQASGATPVILRALDTDNSSNGAFFGNWISGGVNQLSAMVRQNSGQSLNFFARMAVSPAPGAVSVDFSPVPSGVWTQVTFAINPASPQFISFENGDFTTVFSNVGRLQFGVSVPAALAGVNQDFSFDIDKITIVPSPAGLGAFGLCGLGAFRRRRVLAG